MKALLVDIFDDTYIYTKEEGFILDYDLESYHDDLMSLEEIDYVKCSYDLSNIIKEIEFICDINYIVKAVKSVLSGKDEEWIDIDYDGRFKDTDEDLDLSEHYEYIRIYSIEIDEFYS